MPRLGTNPPSSRKKDNSKSQKSKMKTVSSSSTLSSMMSKPMSADRKNMKTTKITKAVNPADKSGKKTKMKRTSGIFGSSIKSSPARSTTSSIGESDAYDHFFSKQNHVKIQQYHNQSIDEGRSISRQRLFGDIPRNTIQQQHFNQQQSNQHTTQQQSNSQPQNYTHYPLTQNGSNGSSHTYGSRRSAVSSVNASESKLQGVRTVIEELNKAIGVERRIAAITNACAEFDHWDVEKHGAELSLGSANVLSLVLSMTDKDDEIRMICAALEMVYRAGYEKVRKSFQEVGNAVVPLLLRLLERCENGTLKHADVSIMNITKVILYFSRVSELRVPLARHQGLLSALTRVATSILNPDCRILRMRVMANLANCEDNKITMLEHSGLVESILKIATLDLSEGAREYASASLMDLASSHFNQIPMARSDKLLGVLVKLAVVDASENAREYALTALQNLAFSKENRTRLTSFGSGVVLEALKKALNSDDNDKARRRAAGALTNLACDETAETMGSHKGLIETLAKISLHDSSDDVQKRACLAITKIAASCTFSMQCFNRVLTALVDASRGTNSSGIAAVFRVRARDVECREVMARHPGLLEILASMSTKSMYSSKDQDNATRAIMHLTNENKNRKLMCNKIILQALVDASNLEGLENTEMRDSAVLAIERLATEVSNRQCMSRHDGLLVAIARAAEREYKSELAGEKTTQPRLAKPLLMSLLVSM